LENGSVMYDGSFHDKTFRPFHEGSVVCIGRVHDELRLTALPEGFS